jgi:hypothetical protein
MLSLNLCTTYNNVSLPPHNPSACQAASASREEGGRNTYRRILENINALYFTALNAHAPHFQQHQPRSATAHLLVPDVDVVRLCARVSRNRHVTRELAGEEGSVAIVNALPSDGEVDIKVDVLAKLARE